MSRIGKISPLKRDYSSSQIQTMQSELARKGMTRIPGTAVFKFPYKEMSGKYRTGLDPNAAYIDRIADDTEREIERERVKKLKEKLQAALNLDLSPTAPFWNHSKSTSDADMTHVQPAKLIDGDNLFDLKDPLKELTYSWLRVHPTIASSFQAWERGEYPADTQFYVADDDIENQVAYKKKQLINSAIVEFQQMSIEKRRKVARQLGLPVSDNTKEEVVYNLVDNILKETELKEGKHKGLNSVQIFTKFAKMDEKILHIKDLINQALTLNVYRTKQGGRIFKGEFELAKDEDDLVKHLADDDNQEDLITLEQELKHKKIAAI